eukprot:scaffold65535_cov33-Tisochrysis_lutea.AAC.1
MSRLNTSPTPVAEAYRVEEPGHRAPRCDGDRIHHQAALNQRGALLAGVVVQSSSCEHSSGTTRRERETKVGWMSLNRSDCVVGCVAGVNEDGRERCGRERVGGRSALLTCDVTARPCLLSGGQASLSAQSLFPISQIILYSVVTGGQSDPWKLS